MKKALLLHGWEWDSKGCWFPWLKGELEQQWFEVFVPDLPNTQYPVYEEQMWAIKEYADDLWEGDIIVGHSLWCTLASHYIEKHMLKKLTVILIAPVYPTLWEELAEKLWKYLETLNKYYSRENTFEALDNDYTVFLSDNDPFIKMESAIKHYNNFTKDNKNSVEYKQFHNWYHFSDGAPEPIKQIPEILNYIK